MRAPRGNHGFTFVELLLVMALMVMMLSIAAPSLANFFRGRTLDSEARRLLALTHHGYSRAVSEGVPMVLWFDAGQKKYGLKEAAGWIDQDPRAVEFPLDPDLKLQIQPAQPRKTSAAFGNRLANVPVTTSQRETDSIRFLPDGTIDESSPRAVSLTDRDGISRWLTVTTNNLAYELRTTLD